MCKPRGRLYNAAQKSMDNIPRESSSLSRPTIFGIAGLFISAVVMYAGYAYALADVCAARERFDTVAYISMALALGSALLLIWSAISRRNWLNIFISSASALACLGLAVIAFAAMWVGVTGEVAPDVTVRGSDGVSFAFSEGFRISQVEVGGPQVRWSIRAADQRRPPTAQEIGELSPGRVPEGFVEVEPLRLEGGSLPDGEYRLTATSPCAYRPAQASFTVRQGRVVTTSATR